MYLTQNMSRKYEIDQTGLNEESFHYFSDGGIAKDSVTLASPT
jgi:hypothetical protein